MKALKWINPLLGILFLAQTFSILAVKLLPYRDWFSDLHNLCGIALIITAAAHVILNRSWIKMTYFKKKK